MSERIIGKYKILREISSGGMATVYKGIEQHSQKTVAVKVLHPQLINDASVMRFSREAQSLAKLKHPNILEVYEFAFTGGGSFPRDGVYRRRKLKNCY